MAVFGQPRNLARQPEKSCCFSSLYNKIPFFHFNVLGDRYWYENDLPPSSFTKEQLNEIRKVKLAQVICGNIPSIDFVQPNVFLESDPFLNALMPW